MTRPDPWPKIEGTQCWVPVQQMEPSCTGLMTLSSTAVWQLYNPYSWLGFLLLHHEGKVVSQSVLFTQIVAVEKRSTWSKN